MTKSYLYLLGPIVSALGVYLRYRKKDVGRWLKERRIDGGVDPSKCARCGGIMRERVNYSGPREGKKAHVCSNYPDCRNIIWFND